MRPVLVIGAAGQVGGSLLEALDAGGRVAVGTVSRVAREGCDVFDLTVLGDDGVPRRLTAAEYAVTGDRIALAMGMTGQSGCNSTASILTV